MGSQSLENHSRRDMPQPLQSADEAAQAYAEKVAQDDESYVRAYVAALNLAAEEPGRGLRSATKRLDTDGLTAAVTSDFLANPVYVANALKMIRNAGRIIGGIPTDAFPDCVLVGGTEQFCCTGTLIAPRVVLTAAHCVQGACSARIFVGPEMNPHGTTLSVDSVLVHPDYDHPSSRNDLALLFLEAEVEGVSPRALAARALIDAATDVRAVGYGNTDVNSTFGFGRKRMVDIPIASVACGVNADVATFGCFLGRELVAGRPFLNRDTCNGDSGGPIYVRGEGDTFFLAGLTSRAALNSSRPCGDGGIYPRVDRYLEFIGQAF